MKNYEGSSVEANESEPGLQKSSRNGEKWVGPMNDWNRVTVLGYEVGERELMA